MGKTREGDLRRIGLTHKSCLTTYADFLGENIARYALGERPVFERKARPKCVALLKPHATAMLKIFRSVDHNNFFASCTRACVRKSQRRKPVFLLNKRER